MDFFISHYAFTFCLVACLAGTFISCISPYFAQEVLTVDGRCFNLGILGSSIYVHENFLHFVISFLFALPGIFICEFCYGEWLTLLAVVVAGIYEGFLGLIFGKSCQGFTGVAVLLGAMACICNLNWLGIFFGILVLIFAIAMDSLSESNNIHFLSLIGGVLFVFAFAKPMKLYEKPVEIKTYADYMIPLKCKYSLSSDYGLRVDPISGNSSFHKGIDLACAEGSSVFASRGGTVESVGYDNVYGNYIVINHGDGYKTKYAHLSKILSQKNSEVMQGEKIGKAGSTGYSTGSHLHFMVIKNGKTVNPKSLLKK